jgi:hypothetical protein
MHISTSVGRGGVNASRDVALVQFLLNVHMTKHNTLSVPLTGKVDGHTISAIETFQKLHVRMSHPDGRVDPGGATFRALVARAPNGEPISTRLSGVAWWHTNQRRFTNSNSVENLASPFREHVKSFLAALTAAGAAVTVSATRRHPSRAYLMRYSWDISHSLIAASKVPTQPGCDIIWDHGNTAKSKSAAREMVSLFQIVYRPSLTSRHIQGLAIDMDIVWTGAIIIKNGKGQKVQLGAPQDGATNPVLHAVGASYGVYKLLTDAPHWSSDGH